jgi:hypothetical protein
MAIFSVPVEPKNPNQRLFTSFEGTSYIIDFRWNERDEAWYMDIFTETEDELARGVKVALGAVILRKYSDDRFPPGKFFAADLENTHREAGLDDFGARVRLYYKEAE